MTYKFKLPQIQQRFLCIIIYTYIYIYLFSLYYIAFFLITHLKEIQFPQPPDFLGSFYATEVLKLPVAFVRRDMYENPNDLLGIPDFLWIPNPMICWLNTQNITVWLNICPKNGMYYSKYSSTEHLTYMPNRTRYRLIEEPCCFPHDGPSQ